MISTNLSSLSVSLIFKKILVNLTIFILSIKLVLASISTKLLAFILPNSGIKSLVILINLS